MINGARGLEIGQGMVGSGIQKISIPDPLTKAFQSASSVACGEFYLIGSAVRKCILGEPGFCDDIDFMGAFDLDRIQNHFGNQVVRRWDQFRTIKILHDDLEIDFIAETNIRKALEKRDITLSLMCIDRNGIVYDPLNYIDDLRKKIIRIEDAEQKIQAEPDRILRVLRFASTLGYEVEALTRQACMNHAGLMNMENTEYALNKFINMDPGGKEKALALADEFGILGLVNSLISRRSQCRFNLIVYD